MPASIITQFPTNSSLVRRILFLSAQTPLSSLYYHSQYSTSTEDRTQKLERIADELLSLNKLERYDYSILFRHKLGLTNFGPSLSGLDPSAGGANSVAGAAADTKAAEKTAFDVKLEKFDAAAKIKVIKEVRTFTDLGLKEAKDLVEKTPAVLKKGVTKEEGESIIEKMKALGATVVLE